MDTKITSAIWSNRSFDEADPTAKLAALWLITNEHVNLLGYSELSERRFMFETQLPLEALTKGFAALGEGCVKIAKGYWLKGYIGLQYGRGPSLSKNNYAKALTRLLMAGVDEMLGRAILAEYPELVNVVGFISPWQALRKGSRGSLNHGRGEERRGEEKRRAEQGAAVAPDPAELRKIAVGALKHRQPTTRWSAKELAAFSAAGLDAMPEADFAAQLTPLMAFYDDAQLPRLRKFWKTEEPEADFRRRDLLTLLNNWPGELDRATEFQRWCEKKSEEAAAGRL